MNAIKFYIETYGCRVNQYESQLLRESLNRFGALETLKAQEAEYIYINSCAITSKAERDARNAVYRLRKLVPDAKIILCGCAAQFFNDFVPRKNANYARPDVCIEQNRKKLLISDPLLKSVALQNLESDRHLFAIDSFNRSRAIIKVQDGCSRNCAYCIVPQTRGKPIYRNPDDILVECRNLIGHGFGELVLSGINLGQYKVDRGGSFDFWDLLHFLDSALLPDYQGKIRIRISSIEPSLLTERGLQTLVEAKLVCPHLHLSLQHTAPRVLKNMCRGYYTAENILEFMENIGKYWQPMGMGADILVGFPGETEADVNMLLDFIDASKLTYAHVFPYSRRQGTAAITYADQITQREKTERAKIIRERIKRRQGEFLKTILWRDETTIVVDAVQGSLYHAVNEFYVACYLPARSGFILSKSLKKAKPVGLYKDGLLVEI